MIRLLIVDDHQIFIDGLKSILGTDNRFIVAGEANNGKHAIDYLKNNEVDIVLLDVRMPIMDGVEAAKIIVADFPAVKIIILSMSNETQFILKLLEIGISGYLLKNCGKAELTDALLHIYKNENYYSTEVMQNAMLVFKKSSSENIYSHIELTKREKEIVELISIGCTTKEIAKKLYLTSHTIDSHRKHLIKKFNVKNTAGLISYIIKNRLLNI